MSNKQNEILMETAIETVEETIQIQGLTLTEEEKGRLIDKEYQRLMERDE